MDKTVLKRRMKPTIQCQYGKNCYRKNPHHFMEYAHEHLDKIINKNPSGIESNYDLPSDIAMQKETVLTQLKMVNDLFPNLKMEPQSKKEKNQPESSKEVNKPKENEGEKSENGNEVSAAETAAYPQKEIKTVENSKPSCSSITEAPSKMVVEKSSYQSAQQSEFPTRNIHDYIKVVLPKGKMAEKLAAAHPYNYFLTAITSSPSTHTEPLSITLQEILDPSLGELESSVQINFMVDIGWLLGHYYFAGQLDKPLLVLYGSETPELQMISKKKPQVTAHFIRMVPFATHHTKMMLLAYKDKSMRVVVSTANLYEDDWHNRTQGLWISPRLESMPEGLDTTAGESPTEFRNELLKYLTSYNLPKLQPWLVRIRKTNFKSVNVFLITSVPGTHHEGPKGYPYGHARVNWLLYKHSAPIDESVPVVAQSSSLGSFGANANAWLLTEFLNSFRRDSQPAGLRKLPQFKMIYPSFNNVIGSHDGLLGGGCLPYGGQIHQKQEWLNAYLYQWKADVRFRSQAMPHIKTYSRWTDKKLFWFILTSANLSKAAWGSFNKSAKINVPIRVSNYEAGVLFLPKFVTGTDYFSRDPSDTTTPVFPALYDTPLVKYAIDDTPFLSDVLFGG